MTHSSLPPVRMARGVAVSLVSALSLALLAGCGGSGGTDSARLRAVDAATDSGTANILVNSSATYGDQSYFAVSSYFYIGSGSSSFTALANTQSSSTQARTNSYSLSDGQFYTAYLVGRPTTALPTNTGFSEILVTNDSKPTLTGNQAAIRVIDAAPDAGGVDVLVNGSAPAPSFSGVTFQKAVDNTFVGTYIPVPAGTLSVRVNLTGTSKAIIPATTVNVQAGRGYTLLVTEPTAGTAATGTVGGTAPTYALQTTSE